MIRRALTPSAPSGAKGRISALNSSRNSQLDTSRQMNGSRNLEMFDHAFHDLFQELNVTGDELAQGLTPDISGDDVLNAIEGSDEPKRIGRVAPAIAKVKRNLESLRIRLISLIEGNENTLNELASGLVSISETGSAADQRTAALILDAMLHWEGVDLSHFEKGDSSLTVKFASLLRIVLTKSTERLTLTAAARSLGRLAKVSDSASRVDFVRFETVRAMEWLHLDAHANRRLAAVLVLRYLTEMVPMLFVTHDHTTSFFDRVGSALLDKSPQTRFAARDALQAFFALINTREDQELCFRKCYAIVRRGIERIHTAESIHGALLAVGEMLRNPNELLRPVFASLCQEILRFKNHSDAYVVRAVLNLVPQLAAFSKDFATTPHLQVSMDLLILKARPGPQIDRATNEAALRSLGRLVAQLGQISSTLFTSDVGRIVAVIREALRCTELAQPALVCLCSLAKVMGELLLNESLSLLDDTFRYPAGLTHPNEWLAALEAFMSIPAARPLIRARLIHEVSIALTGKPFPVPPTLPRRNFTPADVEEEEDLLFFIQVLSKQAPSSVTSATPGATILSGTNGVASGASARSSNLDTSIGIGNRSTNMLMMANSKVPLLDVLNGGKLQQSAFKALGKFDFGPLNLIPFIKQRVLPYLDARSPLRTDAASACVRTLSRQFSRGNMLNFKSHATTGDVVKAILFLATGDLDPSVRLFAMNLLQSNVDIFGPFLGQAKCLQMLFTSLNDSRFQVRQTAVQLVQNVGKVNPGVVLPFMRKYVIGLVGSLRSSSNQREEIETAMVLEDVIREFYQPGVKDLGEGLLTPFMEMILKELINKLKARGGSSSIGHLIQCLGACSLAADPHRLLHKMLLDAIPMVIDAAMDTEASQKQRESALKTLTELLRRTESIGYLVSNVALINPLLEIASAPPNSVFSWSLQREAIRCLGTLGALDPSSHQKSAASVTDSASCNGTSLSTGPIMNEGTVLKVGGAHNSNHEDDFGINVQAVGRPSKRRRRSSMMMLRSGGSAGESRSIMNNLNNAYSSNSVVMRMRLMSMGGTDHYNEDGLGYVDGGGRSGRSMSLLGPDDAASDSSSDQSDSEENLLPVRGPVAEFGSSTQEQLEAHFRLVAVQALTKILKTPALASFHAHVVEAAGNTCRSLGVDTVPYLSRLVPAMIRVALAPRCEAELRRTTIKQLTVFISVMRKLMRPYIREVLALAKMFWDENIFEALALVEETSSALKEEFVVHISWVVPKLIQALRRVVDSDPAAGAKKARPMDSMASSVGTQAGNTSMLKSDNDKSILGVSSGPTSISGDGSTGTSSPSSVLMGSTSKSLSGGGVGGSSPSDDAVTRRALGTVQFLGLWISESEHSHRVAAEIIDVINSRAASDGTRVRCLEVLRFLCQHDTFTMDVIPIAQCIVRILASSPATLTMDIPSTVTGGPNQSVIAPSMELFGILIERFQAEVNFEPFVDMLPERFRARLQKRRAFDNLLVMSGERDRDEDTSEDGASVSTGAGSVEESGNNLLLTTMISEVSKSRSSSMASGTSEVAKGDGVSGASLGPLSVNPHKLREALEASQATTEDDWTEWMRRFAVELLRESPDPTLRACASVAQAHHPLARDLFNAAFVSCWTRLSAEDCAVMVRTLKAAFRHKNTPPDVLHVLLNLCEFMEHNDRPLPIERLSEYAMKCHAYAKALNYKEMEFRASKNAVIVDDLIGINHRLERPEAAQGLLKIAHNQQQAALVATHYEVYPSGVPQSTQPTQNGATTNTIPSVGSPFVTLLPGGPRRRGSVNAIVVQVRETWYEQLGRWRDALESYEAKLNQLPEDSSATTSQRIELTLGSLRCMLSLGEYDRLVDLGKRKWRSLDSANKQRMAPLIAHALWEKGADSAEMQQYLPFLDGSKLDGAVLNAVAAIQRGDWLGANTLLDEARRVLASELSTSVSESYARAYPQIVLVQQLVELEEVAQLRQNQQTSSSWSLGATPSLLPNHPGNSSSNASEEEGVGHLRLLWDKRLRVCQRSVNVWQKLMAARILVVPPREDAATWIKFVSICRREERWGLARSTLKRLGVVGDYEIGSSLANGAPPRSVFAMLKLCWVGANDRPPAGDKTKSYAALNSFVDTLSSRLAHYPPAHSGKDSEELRKLIVKCRLKLGEWTSSLHGEGAGQEAMRHVEMARKLEPNSHKAAHAWASLNYLQFESGSGNSGHLIEAVKGFFSSIALGRSAGGSTSIIMQDVLRLLTLWFDQSPKYPKAAQAIREGFQQRRIPIGTWLNVVPQLIARIQSNPTSLRELLVELGSTYPQALVYPLTVAARSVDPRVRGAAEGILSELRRTQAVLLDQAALVARELIRVAILLPEEWHEALEDACKVWYPVPTNEGEVRTPERMRERFRALKAVQECLVDVNARLKDYPGKTRHEADFLRKFGKNLERASDLVNLYEERRGYEHPGRNRHMQEAWSEYKKIYAEIGDKYLKELSVLELEDISPMLLAQRDLELAVPGTFRADIPASELVRIKAFGSRVKVFPTKQRPRRLGLLGSNGYTYRYLLKGHEDLRQDERAMQLFGLVNALLQKATLKRDLAIQTYIVIPLSPHVGLIGWLPQTDTLHSLIRRYRAEKRIALNIEQQWSNKISPFHAGGAHHTSAAAMRDPAAPGNAEGYDRLTLIQKVEAFEYSLESNRGDDLAKVMWHKARSAEVWLDRRTVFTRSLATMSMVGYILGLGDRHPSNLMLHRTSGRIVHIDFGDCFEVAAHRDKYPERVPFRLTRMLVNAMEVSGIEGNFRISCEAVMGVLRDNRDSVMAMLEAFVHDPLISWRLWAQQNEALQHEDIPLASVPSNRNNIPGNNNNADRAGEGDDEDDDVDPLGRRISPEFEDIVEEDDEAEQDSVPSRPGGRGSDRQLLGPGPPLGRPAPAQAQIQLQATTQAPTTERIALQRQQRPEDPRLLARQESDRDVDDDEDEQELAVSARAQPIPMGRPGSSMVPDTATLATSARRDKASMVPLSQSYRSRGARDKQRVRRFSVTYDASLEVPSAIAEPVLNKQAVQVVRRVKDKLTGHDFATADGMNVVEQVDKLIRQATSHENLSTAFLGWCAFW